MRRSAAPSNVGKESFKRPRFTPPTKNGGGIQSESPNQNQSNSYNSPAPLRHQNNNTMTMKQSSYVLKSPAPKLFENIIANNPKISIFSSPNSVTTTAKTTILTPLLHHNDSGELQNRNRIENSQSQSPALMPNADATTKRTFQPLKMNSKISTVMKTPFGDTRTQTTSQPCEARKASPAPGCRYLSVVWCKMSKKKHKKWEGDAVLVTQGRTTSLYDMEGKIIGKGTGYKVAELESLKEDETLFVGGKEIQVMSEFSEDHFLSGKCFSAGIPESSPAHVPQKTQAASKPFSNPLLKGATACKSTSKPVVGGTSRFDPAAPGAVVMQRPGADHQWQHNKSGLPVCEVVVDPYLSSWLRPHQVRGVAFLYDCVMGLRDYGGRGAVLADDMGLGKTLQCICLIWTLLKQGPYGGKPVVKKVLVVTPGSLVKNWAQEFKKWLGSERLSVFAVSADRKIQEFIHSGQYPVLIISYEMFVRVYDDLVNSVNFDLVICDEGHRLKNTAIKTTSLIMSLATRRRIVLTGTPVQNDLQEFFSIVEFCNPGVLGSAAAFRRVYEDPIVASRQPEACSVSRALGEERAAELTRLTQMFVLRRTQEVNNQYLPPKVELVLFCRPSQLQLTLYRKLLSTGLIRRCLRGSLSGPAHLTCIGALKNLCNHPGLTYCKAAEADMARRGGGEGEDSIYDGLLPSFPSSFDPNSVSTVDSGKLEVLSQILASIWRHSSTEKVVLVSNHTKTLDFLSVFCEAQGYMSLRLDGQTPTARRQDLVTRFNTRGGTHRIFLLSSKAGGVGLNLVGASRLILYDIDWNPANDLQAMARVWRDGQRHKVHIYRLLTVGTIEEKMYQRQVSKQGLSGAVMVTSGARTDVKFSLDDLRDLFTLNESTDCETHTMLECPCGGDPLYEGGEGRNKEDEEEEDERPCQLSNMAQTESKTTNLTMAELLHWKHWKGHHARSMESWFLDETNSAVSYVFWHEINHAEKRSNQL